MAANNPSSCGEHQEDNVIEDWELGRDKLVREMHPTITRHEHVENVQQRLSENVSLKANPYKEARSDKSGDKCLSVFKQIERGV